MLETLIFVYGSAMWSLIIVMSGCSLNERGQGHVSNFYIVDLENFAAASRRYTGDIHNSSVVGLFMTPIRQLKATRSRHGWVHIITHCLQLYNIDIVRTCRTSSFYTCVAIGKISTDTTHRAVPRR